MTTGVGSSEGISLVSGVGQGIMSGVGLSEGTSLVSGLGESKIITSVPWDTNKMLPDQIDAVNAYLEAYAQNSQGQTFTWEHSLYDDPDLLRQMFYLKAKMDNTAFTQSKHVPADALPDNEVIGFIAADLQRMVDLAYYHATIGELGPLGEIEVEEE